MIARWLWPGMRRDGKPFTLRRWWRSNYRWTLLLQSRVGRGIERLLWRLPPWKAFVGRIVWGEIARDKQFAARIEAGLADVKAGRVHPYDPDPLTVPGDE